MASPLVLLFSAGISSAFTPFTVLIMVTFMEFAFDAEDVATDAVNAFELFDVGCAVAVASSVGVVDVVFVASVNAVVTTAPFTVLSMLLSVAFVIDATDVAFGVGVDANASTTFSCLLSLLLLSVTVAEEMHSCCLSLLSVSISADAEPLAFDTFDVSTIVGYSFGATVVADSVVTAEHTGFDWSHRILV